MGPDVACLVQSAFAITGANFVALFDRGVLLDEKQRSEAQSRYPRTDADPTEQLQIGRPGAAARDSRIGRDRAACQGRSSAVTRCSGARCRCGRAWLSLLEHRSHNGNALRFTHDLKRGRPRHVARRPQLDNVPAWIDGGAGTPKRSRQDHAVYAHLEPRRRAAWRADRQSVQTWLELRELVVGKSRAVVAPCPRHFLGVLEGAPGARELAVFRVAISQVKRCAQLRVELEAGGKQRASLGDLALAHQLAGVVECLDRARASGARLGQSTRGNQPAPDAHHTPQ